MKNFLYVILCVCASTVYAQRQAGEQFQTSNGTVTIQPVYHGALVLSWNNKTIYVDPYGGAKAYEGITAPDLILITDVHPDHLDTKTLSAIETGKASLIVPKAVAEQLPENLKSKASILNNGEKKDWQEINIEAIPMYNLPEEANAMHPKGRGNGYVLTIGDKRIYISGDTEDITEMRKLKNIDVAFVCMNLPYTMDINQAASAVLDFKPAIVYPYHYRGKDGLSDVEAFKKLVNKGNPAIDVRLRDWYAE
jgi:L-ascorbate metabolism protein UlaG (beta-lactamase superfamily)